MTKPQDPAVVSIKKRKDDRIPELELAAKALLAGVISRAEYDKTVKQLKPVTKYASVPRPATDEEALGALHENKRQHWRGADEFPEGHPVGLRLDIPAYTDHGVWVNSIHDESGAKTPVKYGPVSAVKNAEFDPGPSKAQRVATGENKKSPFARIKGEWNPMTDDEAVAHMQKHLSHPDYVQVGYDPRRRDYFYHRGDTRKPITHAEHVVQIGPLVLAKNPVYGKRKDFGLKDGGLAHMDKGGRPPQQTNLDMAREAAERVGQHHDPLTRSLQQGYEHGWYHGSTGDIKAFDPNTRGESTGAASAKKGYFFARDPSTPPPEMLEHDPESLALLQRIGATIPPKPTMAGHGAHTASSYAGTGGSREYKEAMRMAKAAERVGNWDAHQKYMQMAEDAEINNMRYRQDLVAKHGDARDTMYEHIKNAWYGAHNAELFKGMSQPDYEAHDKRYKELMPYGWHIDYEKPHYEALKAQLKKFGNNKQVQSALDAINRYQSVHNERKAADVESGANVMPVALRYKNPMYHDFKGSGYRDQTYSDLMDQAMHGGHDALILKNTYDPGGTGKPKMVDVGVMFHPSQVRSKFAAFDPTRTKESDLLAKRGGVVHMADGGDVDQEDPLRNLPPASPQDTTPMDKYKLAIWAEKNNPDMLTANNNELAALLMRSRIGNTTYDDRSEEEPRLEQRRSISPFSSPEQFQNMPGDNIFGMRREMPRPESFDYPRLEKGIDYRKKIQELEDSITRREKRLGIPYKGAYHAHGGRVTHAHHLDIEERPL